MHGEGGGEGKPYQKSKGGEMGGKPVVGGGEACIRIKEVGSLVSREMWTANSSDHRSFFLFCVFFLRVRPKESSYITN